MSHITLKRIIVHAGKKLVFDIKLMPDGTWRPARSPAKQKKRPKKGRMARLLRQHKKWLNRR